LRSSILHTLFRFVCGYNPGPRSARIAPPLKRDWITTPQAFERLLAWLDESSGSGGSGSRSGSGGSGGEAYLQMRRRLVLYFQRKRCLNPDDLADETLNRVTRRLEEEGRITDATPARYCYIVAKFVLLEHLRDPEVRRMRDVDVREHAGEPAAAPGAPAHDERALDCLDRCLSALAPDERTLILDYYRHEQGARIERRRHLAASLGLTANALAIRACRLRDKLERCVRECRSGRAEDRFRPIRSQRDE
jgi:DNA-directed RNA polymerase specialized sigma24 family protein